MAATNEDIANSALSKLGAEPITSLADTSRRAKLVNQQFNPIRKKLLRSHPWNFAIKRSILTADASTPAFEYSTNFILPSDFLRAVREEEKDVDWKIEGQFLVSNDTDFNLVYIADITDPTEFEPTFDELFALNLAYELAYPLVQSLSLKEDLRRELNGFDLKDARSYDAQEGTPEELETNAWLNSRQGFGG